MWGRRGGRETTMALYWVSVQLVVAARVVGGEVREPEERLAEFTPPPGLCYGRCLSRCGDARKFREAKVDSTHGNDEDAHDDKYCSTVCSPVTADEWITNCKQDTCHIECGLENNSTTEQRTFSSRYPGYPSLRLEVNTPAGLQLTWHSVNNETSDTVLYAVLMKQSSDKWKVVQWTTNTSFNLCSVGSFRVSPVDRSGSLGVSDETTVDNLPKPGVIQIIQKDDDVKFNGEYFLYSFKFKLPAGWKYTDVGEFVATSLGKLCKSTAVPPLPIFNIQLTEEEDIYVAHIRVHRLGFGCQFFSVVQAVSTCSVPGEPFNFTIDLTDCANITGYHCPVTYEPPDAVHNVSVEVLPEVGWVSISWVPPLAPIKLDHYILEYGLLQRIGSFFIRPALKVEGRRVIAETDDAVKLKVKTFDVEYGVKILAVTETMRGNETDVHLRKMYPLAQFIIKAPIVKISESQDMPRENNDSQVALYVLLPLSGLVLATLVALLALTRLRRRSHGHKQLTLVDNQEVTYKAFALQKQVEGCMAKNPLYPPIPTEPEKPHFKDEWEIAYDRLTLTEVIGCGAFGQVVRGTLHQAKSVKRSSSRTSHTAKGPTTQDLTVAIKVLPEHSDESQRRDFIKEIELMKSIGSHPNVVGMIGCCTSPSQPVCLIVEHMPGGDLLHYLRRHRHVNQKVPEKHLSSHDLFSFARQVAVGMEFLSQKGFVHRDLACRNILVSDASTVKIGDFGLTRYIYDDKVYVTHRSGTKLPLKWMAIESVMDLTFTTASDVWAFGVVLFELTTLGGTPYPTLSNRHLLKELQAGYRMEQPENCPQSLYSMMQDCWLEDPSSRPTFTALRQQLDVIIEDHSTVSYINFDLTASGTCCNDDSDSDDGRLGDSWLPTTDASASGQLGDRAALDKILAKASSVPHLAFGRAGQCSEFLRDSVSAHSSGHLVALVDPPSDPRTRLLPQ